MSIFKVYTENAVKKLSALSSKLRIYLWSSVYKRWLHNWKGEKVRTVVEVINWRTALIINKRGYKERITPCFRLFGYRFD